jgi:hypothetical protein
VLDGHAPWATSWNIAGRFCVAAESDDGRIVWSMLPGDLGACVMTTPLDLPVFAATGTVSVTIDGCRVADDDVVSVGDMAEWRSIDRRRASIGQPAVLGVTERAVRLLADAARDADDEAMATASRLEDELARLWSDDDDLVRRLADPAAGDEAVADASRHRAACLDVSRRATTALLAAVGGAGMDLGHPAQRLAREATFYVIQAQTIDGRNATLRSV